MPLVLGLHGGLMTGWGHSIYTSWCYVADAVNAILTLLCWGEPGQAYNVANRNAVASIREYALMQHIMVVEP